MVEKVGRKGQQQEVGFTSGAIIAMNVKCGDIIVTFELDCRVSDV
jgi:hypothetical protein